MPVYVYKCRNEVCGNIQEEEHSIKDCDMIEVECVECGEVMARVPQPFRWGRSSWDTLAEHFDEGWRNYKRKVSKRRKRPLVRTKDWENLDGEVVEMKR